MTLLLVDTRIKTNATMALKCSRDSIPIMGLKEIIVAMEET